MPPSRILKPNRRRIPSFPATTLLPLPNRLARKNRKATPTSELTHEQIEYLVAEANAKTEQRSKPWTAVPNPIPDTGINTVNQHAELKHISSVSEASISSSVFTTSTFSQSSPISSASTGLIYHPSSTTINQLIASRQTPQALQSSIPPMPTKSAAPIPPSTHRLSGVAISLIAVAGVCLLVGVFFLFKVCLRPTRAPRPVPSRPILDPSLADDDIFQPKLEDSPVFGGKERMSERPSNAGLFQWTQYTAPKEKTMTLGNDDEKSRFDETRVSQISAASEYPAPIQQVQNVLNRAAHRISSASASFYPTSQAQLVTSFTADGQSVIERINPKILQRSRSSTVGERSRRDLSQTKTSRYSYGFAYDGAEVASPKLPMQSPAIPTPQGRTRIMSSYYAHPRTSHAQPTGKVHEPKTASSATTPITTVPVSPQSTLYPDDSLSMVEARRNRIPRRTPTANANARVSRVFGREDSRGVIASPTVDATAALGNLMLMDFGGTKQSGLNATLSSSSSSANTKSMARSDDKPPRVPSPPPLPSLAQMSWEHSNPEGYADYRSPTYSIYNLYGK
ncbi:hypothetical protein MIND_01023300 [Mycena indigotica]|uniref:Uncharacterized protein n=1 Tax=Mycena indigotica TaxID=2126181 RepID=A0A8H6VUY1_9AGAR|nr:uncharacterized protein MIND_01023300 [Mycena indigotica]KAF7294854.1 hypothetical protein MIND_01023300 [Mycena indigotica]